jgi:hypothetical protein
MLAMIIVYFDVGVKNKVRRRNEDSREKEPGPFARTTSPEATQTGLTVPYKTSGTRIAFNFE